MDEIHKQVLQKNRRYLVANLCVDKVMKKLIKHHDMFTEHMLHTIYKESAPRGQTRQLLDVLPRRGPQAFSRFLKALEATGHTEVVKHLQAQVCIYQETPTLTPSQHMESIYIRSESPYSSMKSYPDDLILNHTGNSHLWLPVQSPHPSLSAPELSVAAELEDMEDLCSHFGAELTGCALSTDLPRMQELAGMSITCKQYQTRLCALQQTVQTEQNQKKILRLLEKLDTMLSNYKNVTQRMNTNRYLNNPPTKGEMFVINNYKFNEGTNSRERQGAKRDTERLVSTFSSLGFSVHFEENRTAKQMLVDLQQFRDKYTRSQLCSSLVVVVMSHGPRRGPHNMDLVSGVDGMAVTVQNHIIGLFHRDSAPWLVGKPKLFIIQACRGDKMDTGYKMVSLSDTACGATRTDLNQDDTPCVLEDSAQGRVRTRKAALADMLIANATVPGKCSATKRGGVLSLGSGAVAWRDKEEGSWFIEAICDVFGKHHTTEHVMDMLVKVNEILSTKENEAHVQQPIHDCMLTKKWYLCPTEQHGE